MPRVISQDLANYITQGVSKRVSVRDKTKFDNNTGLMDLYLHGTKILSYGHIQGVKTLILTPQGFDTRTTFSRLREISNLLTNNHFNIKKIKGQYYIIYNDGFKEIFNINLPKIFNNLP